MPAVKPDQDESRFREWLVERVTPDAGDLVFDLFAGAGTTIIAAEILRRRCVAMELSEAYVDVIRQRYADFTGQPHLAP